MRQRTRGGQLCRRPLCRRRRMCMPPVSGCIKPRCARPMSPRQEAASKAALKRMLERRLAELRGGGSGQGSG
jgi:hypothetical protein